MADGCVMCQRVALVQEGRLAALVRELRGVPAPLRPPGAGVRRGGVLRRPRDRPHREAARGRLAPADRARARLVRRAAHLLGELRRLAGDRLLGRARLHRRLGLLPALRPPRPAAGRARGGLGPRSGSARGGTAPLAAAGPLHRSGLPVGAHGRAGAVEGGAPGRRRLAAGPLLRGHPPCLGAPAVDRGRLLLAVGAHVAAAVPGPLVRDRRQAGLVHHGPLVRALTRPEAESPR